MLVFKSRPFQKWANKMRISDFEIIKAVNEIEAGLVDACIGGNLYKKRVALMNKGSKK